MYVPPSALTADQRRAVCQHGPLIVRASAGSGKTRVLVERYVRLLLDGYDVRRIVAMTFTRKAAAEMLDRTARRLDQLFEAAQQPDQLLYLRTLRERLIGAHISTFHSYCSSLLRRFPIEAGIEPTFGELSAADTVRLMRDAIRITVEQWLADHRRNDVADLLMVFGSYQTLENALNQVLSDAQHIESLADSSEPDEIVLRVGSALRAIADDQLSLWRRLLWQANEQSLPPKIKKSPPLEEVERILDQLQQSVHTIGRFDADAPWRSILREALGIFHERSSDSLRSPWKYLANATELLRSTQRCRVLQHAIDTTQEIEIQAWNAVVLLQRLAREALLWMDREKNLLAAFGPDDLQRRAVKLLDVSTVRERLVREIQHVLVDEFQDTDPIEYDLLQKLIPLPHVVEGVPELFIVGDPKQSIYGFRGADVRVFERARNDIVAAGGAGADVRLQTSFRMTPALVAVVNTVMRSIMPESTRGYDVGYEELCTARPEERCPTSAVALLISASDDEQTDEATLVARHIVHCTAAEPLQVWDEHIVGDDGVRGGFRPVQYRDIVLLARKFSTFEPYVRALRQAGLPFRIESGRGFYRTQEILDVTAFLRLVHNRHDDIALATFLRSPFVGLDDSQLTLIATTPPTHGSLYERMVSFVEHDGNSAIADARALLDELLAIAIRMPPTALMRMLLRRTPWYSRVAVSPRRQQIEANIEKLLD
ncbi:MAG: UvrD-helicase domain-containing protein, partial [Chlorobi bacterium]|nr:UvrD-helicase domain-containing protein [Chlorobiota bacterium]